MNHIYKTVWNATLGTWTAVQETAKSHGKSSSGKVAHAASRNGMSVRFAFTLVASALLLASGQVMAVTGIGQDTTDIACFFDTTSLSVVCGDASTSVVDTYGGKQAKAVAVGLGATTTGESNVALGANSSASHTSGLAIGAESKAHHNQTVAIGERANALGEADVSVGKGAGEGITSTGRNVAIGEGAVASIYHQVSGQRVVKTQAEANNVIGIGTSAAAGIKGSHNIAMGAHANSEMAIATALANGVTAAEIGATDRVTADNTIALGQRSLASKTAAVAVGQQAKALGGRSAAIGNGSKAGGENAVAAGSYATATGTNSVAIGGSQNNTDASKTLANAHFSVAIGSVAQATATGAIAMGQNAVAAGKETVSLGAGSGSKGVDAANATSQIVPRTKAGTTSSNGLVHMTNIGYKAGADNINNNYGVNIGYEAGAGGYNSYYGEGVSIGNKAGGVNTSNAAVAAAMRATSQAQGGVAADVIITGNTNTAISSRAGVNALGHDNVAIGKDAGGYSSGNNNVAIGRNAGREQAMAPTGAYADQVVADAFSKAGNTIAVGEWAHGSADDATAIGTRAKAGIKSSIAFGKDAKTTGTEKEEGALAIGRNAHADGQGSTAMGINARSAKQSIAIGTNANNAFGVPQTIGASSVSIGNNTNAAGENTVALGNQSTATGDKATALGFDTKAEGQSSVVIGDSAQNKRDTGVTSHPHADQAVVVGVSSNVNSLGGVAVGSTTKTTGVYGTAVGIGSVNNTNFGVALGALSTTDQAIQVDRAGYAPVASAQTAIDATKANAAGVSVGGKVLSTQGSGPGQTAVRPDGVNDGDIIRRQIHNVAAGTDDTDAVNVAQLKAVTDVAKAAGTHYYSVNSTVTGANSNYNNDGATGSNALAAGVKAQAAGENSVAVGNEASAGHNLSVAIGHAAQTRGKHSLAIGARAKAGTKTSPSAAVDAGSWGTAIGYNAEAEGDGSPLAIGTESKTVGGQSPIAIGDWATAEGTGAIAIGGKIGGKHLPGQSTYAKGVQTTALGYLAQATEQGALAVGANANASLANAVALGAGSLTSTNATQETHATVGGITYGAAPAAGPAPAPVGNSFAGAANVQAGDQVSVGSAGSERQIKHVAPGAISATSTDAINGSQLHATQAVIGNVAGSVKNILGGNADVGGDGTLSMNDIGGTGKGTIHEAIAAATTKVTSNNSSIGVTHDATTNTYDLSVNAQGLAESAQLPVVYTKADGTKVYKRGTKFYDQATGGNEVPAADIVASMQNPDGTTTAATTLANVKAGVNDNDAVNVGQLPFAYVNDAQEILTRSVDANGNVTFYKQDGSVYQEKDISISTLNPTNAQQVAQPTKIGNVAMGVLGTDAVNVSQLQGAAAALGGGAGVNTDGTFKAPSYVINKTDGTSYAAVDNVGAALGNLNAEVVKPLSFAGDSGSDIDRKLGSTLNVKGGATGALSDGNIGVVADATTNTLNIKLAQNINLGAAGSVQTGNTTVNNAGITINEYDPAGAITKTVSLTSNGLDNGGNKISNVANGAAPNDAVNFSQLQAVEAAANAAKTHYYSVNSTVTGANSNYNNDGATGANALAAGVGASATGISATAVGHGATAGAEFAVAVGLDAQATASGAMAFGNGAQAAGQDSLAHGKASKATGNFATAVGNAASAGLHATAVGNGAAASGNYATSFGTGSQATGGGSAALGNDAKASEWAAVAVGRDAQATQTAAVAIGEGARAAHEHSVALGSGSATAAVDNTGRASATVGGITYSGFAADAPTSMVSVGRDETTIANPTDPSAAPTVLPAVKRTITHVAAGRIAADSTDAINGSQLHATQAVIGNVAGSVKNILGGNAAVGGDGTLSMSNIGGTGKSTIDEAIAAVNNTAGAGWGIGNGGQAPVATVKPGARVDFVAGNGSTKVDVTHDATNSNSKVTVSAAPGALQYTGTNNADGSNTPNADQFTPTNQVTLVGAAGNTGGVTINNVAPAELSATSKQAVNGSQLHAMGSSTAAALGGTSAFDPATGTVTAGLNVGGTTHTSVQDALNAINTTAGAGWNLQANDGAVSNVKPNNTVKVVDGSNTKVTLTGTTLKVDVVDAPTFTGKVTAGGGLDVAGGSLAVAAGTNVDMGSNIIHNVADGAADTDAVNVRQLRAVSGNITDITNQIGAVDARVTNVDNRVTHLSGRVDGIDARVTNVDNRVTQVDNRVTDLTGRVDGIDTRVADVTNLVGPNLTNPDGTKGLEVYDVSKQTLTEHKTVIEALNQVKREGTKYSHTQDNGEAPIIGPSNAASAGALASTATGVNAIVDKEAESGFAGGHRARVLRRGKKGIAVGHEAVAGGESAVAVGDGAEAHGDQSLSFGTKNRVYADRSGAIGDPTTIIASATDSYSIGNNNTVNTADTFVLGNNVVTSVANSVYLGAGAAATAAPTAQTAGMASYNAQTIDGVTHHYAGGTPAGVVSVGDVGQERRIQNVAAGLVSPTSTDAINGSQLYQTNAAIGNLNNRININHDKAMGGIASAMASAGLPQAYLPGKSMIAMGVGAYQGRSAVAVGVSTISDNGRWIIKGSVNANNKGNVGATLGAGYQW